MADLMIKLLSLRFHQQSFRLLIPTQPWRNRMELLTAELRAQFGIILS